MWNTQDETPVKVQVETLKQFPFSTLSLMHITYYNPSSKKVEVTMGINELCTYYYNLGKKHAFNESNQVPALFKRKELL